MQTAVSARLDVHRYQLRDRAPVLRAWLVHEDRILRTMYEREGARACAARIPDRSLAAIYSRAQALGLRAPKVQRAGVPRNPPYAFTEAVDAQIRAVYANPTRGRVNELAARLMMPRQTINRRAAVLGLVAPRFRQPPWTPAEIDLLERHATKSPATIQRILKKAGFSRTETAIIVRLKREKIDTREPGVYCPQSLARLMGVDRTTVVRWIETENLPSTVTDGRHRITDAQLRTWIRNHARLVDLRKVDRYWFIELALGAPMMLRRVCE